MPEVSSFGETEQTCQQKKLDYVVGALFERLGVDHQLDAGYDCLAALAAKQ